MVRISVLLTSYNHAKYLREAIDSVLAQTFADFELLIVDDGSTDESWEIIGSYADPRVRGFRTGEQNITTAVNQLIAQQAVGEFIAIFHSDDVWRTDKLAQQVTYLDQHTECGAVFTQTIALDEGGQPLSDGAAGIASIFAQPNRSRQQWLRYFFYQMNALCHPSVLIRKQCYLDIGFYRETMWALDDFDLWVRLCLRYEIHVLEDALTCFRVRADHGNVSGNKIGTHVRTATEFFFVLRHYLTIDSFEELVHIFPEAQVYYRAEGCEPHFVLAMMALAQQAFPQTQLFGLSLLFDLLEDAESARRIDVLYGFKPADFHALKVQHDVFRVKQLHEAEQKIAMLETASPAAPAIHSVASLNDVVRLWGDDPRLFSQVGVRTIWGDLETTGQAGYLMYGPYLPFAKGHYQVVVRGSVGRAGARFDVTAVHGSQTIVAMDIVEADETGCLVRILIELTDDCTDLECRISVSAECNLRVAMLEITPLQFADTAMTGTRPTQLPVDISVCRPLRIMLMGNCQSLVLATLIGMMASEVVEAKGWKWTQEFRQRLLNSDAELMDWLLNSDLILLHKEGGFYQWFEQHYPNLRFKVRYIPSISFGAWHPDLDLISIGQEEACGYVEGSMGACQSTLAFYGWKQGWDVEQTLNLFATDIYELMGYFDAYAGWKEFLVEEGVRGNLPLGHLIDEWSRRGCWMHSIYHPKLFVLVDVARELMLREQIMINTSVQPETLIEDDFLNSPIWPIYPEIAEHYGLTGDYVFRSNEREQTLREFVVDSFARFDQYGGATLGSDMYAAEQLKVLHERLTLYLAHRKPVDERIMPKALPVAALSNPYRNLPDYHFWRRAVEQVPVQQLDPVVRARVHLRADSKVATAGSCFAQHISRALRQHGYNNYITETGIGLSAAEAEQRNYGVYSARYGNVYTARQLVQLFDRAYGDYAPSEQAWLREDGRFVDPFRPQIEPDGFAQIEALEQSRAEQFSAVRELFENLDVFVFTLGLTEAWRNRSDGAVFPLAPGVVAGAMNPREHEFINFNTQDVIGDLQAFINRLLRINPAAKMILTVSPVPLIATYEDQHVLVSNTYSKSVLRAAAEEICRRNAMCEYFPAYEMITGHYNHGAWFEGDLRSVRAEGIEHVMRTFFKHYAADEAGMADGEGKASAARVVLNYAAVAGVVCEEAALDQPSV
ncbi:MAG: GSCFA domain-containing protein [Sulfuriferula sp.]